MSDHPAADPTQAAQFGLKDPVDLLIKQTALVNALWGIYAAVSFTAASFGLTLRSAMPGHALPISLLAATGFGVFLYGHWAMLRSAVLVIQAVSTELTAMQNSQAAAGVPFHKTTSVLISTSYTIKGSGLAHLAIDFCSMSVLLAAPQLRLS